MLGHVAAADAPQRERGRFRVSLLRCGGGADEGSRRLATGRGGRRLNWASDDGRGLGLKGSETKEGGRRDELCCRRNGRTEKGERSGRRRRSHCRAKKLSPRTTAVAGEWMLLLTSPYTKSLFVLPFCPNLNRISYLKNNKSSNSVHYTCWMIELR